MLMLYFITNNGYLITPTTMSLLGRNITEIVEYKLKEKLNDFLNTPAGAVCSVDGGGGFLQLHRLMFQTQQFKQKQLKSGLMEPRARCCSKLHILSTLEFLNINIILQW